MSGHVTAKQKERKLGIDASAKVKLFGKEIVLSIPLFTYFNLLTIDAEKPAGRIVLETRASSPIPPTAPDKLLTQSLIASAIDSGFWRKARMDISSGKKASDEPLRITVLKGLDSLPTQAVVQGKHTLIILDANSKGIEITRFSGTVEVRR